MVSKAPASTCGSYVSTSIFMSHGSTRCTEVNLSTVVTGTWTVPTVSSRLLYRHEFGTRRQVQRTLPDRVPDRALHHVEVEPVGVT